MPLIDAVKKACKRLAPEGWGDLLSVHGLDIGKADLAGELKRDLPAIDRTFPGFEDFALEGKRGIEPGQPARSLLYHAFASPNVLFGKDRHHLSVYPTLAEIEAVENYVYGAEPPTLEQLAQRAGNAALAVVVFAYEYRVASQTGHKRHADLVFSRTGVARVGTAPALYDGQRRGFTPVVDTDPFALRVMPARYAAFLAARATGDATRFRPMRFQKGDDKLQFWFPVHKLFPGPQCLQGLGQDLDVTLIPHHVNEKIRRIHLALTTAKHNTGWGAPDIDNPPFRFTDGIAEWSKDPDHGSGTLVPVVHRPLVDRAEYKGKPLSFHVPPNAGFLATSLEIATNNDALPAPEYVHIRTQVKDGKETDLNTKPNLAALLSELARKGDFWALHHVDYTGDGWVETACPQLAAPALKIGGPVPAYSLVTPPDFFPACDQRDLTEWTNSLPEDFRKSIWETDPDTLSDQRLAANLQLPGSPFKKDDVTITALVAAFGDVSPHQTLTPAADPLRHCHLPDQAAGVFAPGWDVSMDQITQGALKGTQHLANYGLGSPFPEDAKLCAALSTFWPAAAPDATRTFEFGPLSNRYFTVSPLTDEEIGQVGKLPWDGIAGPRVVTTSGGEFAEYFSIDYADYVANALRGKFSLRVTAHIDEKEYQNRVFAMAMVYKVLPGKKLNWVVLSFLPATTGDPEFQQAQAEGKLMLPGDTYRFVVFRNPEKTVKGSAFNKVRLRIDDKRTLFADPNNRRILFTRPNGKWAGKEFPRV